MSGGEFPDRIFVADTAPPGSGQAELVYSEQAASVAGLPWRAYVPVPPIDWERLARAEVHWLRVSILQLLLIDGGRVLSPSEIAAELQQALNTTNYHVTQLVKAGIIELVTTKKRRGATEHYYRPSPQGESECQSAPHQV